MTVPDGEEESELDRGLLSDGHELEPLHPLWKKKALVVGRNGRSIR